MALGTHAEFYGAEPPLRNAASLYKGVLTAERSLQKARMDAAENACPSIQGLELSTTPGNVRIIGRASFPSLAKTPERSAALIERIEARVNSRSGAVIDALVFQVDTRGSFTASAVSSVVPAGPVLVLVVLKDGSEMSGLVEQASPYRFVAVRLFEKPWNDPTEPWTVTENSEGRMRAEWTVTDRFSTTLSCKVLIEWAMPTSIDQPLQLRITRQRVRADGVDWSSDSIGVLSLSYKSGGMPVGKGEYAIRSGANIVSPPTTGTRTDQGYQLNLSYLGSVTPDYGWPPYLYLKTRSLCGSGVDYETEIRFDYTRSP